MLAVVNTMTLSRPIPTEVLVRLRTDLVPLARGVEGFEDVIVVHVADEQLVFVVLCRTEAAMAKLHEEVAGPWIGQNIRPYVARVDRRVGTVVAGRE